MQNINFSLIKLCMKFLNNTKFLHSFTKVEYRKAERLFDYKSK